MPNRRLLRPGFCVLLLLLSLVAGACAAPSAALKPQSMQKRWLFVWQDMSDPKQVDRMIARFPRAQAAGYNGVAFSSNVPAAKAAALRQAAKAHGLDLIAIVMGGSHDRNYMVCSRKTPSSSRGTARRSTSRTTPLRY